MMSMEIAMRVLVWSMVLVTSVPMIVVITEIFTALGFRRQKKKWLVEKEFPDTVVLIPAHNEEVLIERCLASLSIDLPSDSRLVCVAHNCTDLTADTARRLGAEVIEVEDDGSGGKPDALRAGLQWLDDCPPEVVVVVDADCVVSVGAVKILSSRVKALNQPVMGAYHFSPAGGANGIAILSSLAALLKNCIRPLGLHALGLPCLLNGSGSAYPFRAIRDAPHGEGAIAEDYQLTVDLLRQGYPTAFVPEVRIDGQLPIGSNTALSQRRRWEHGHMFLIFRTGPCLLLEGLKRCDMAYTALALEVMVPPLAFLGLMWCFAAGLSLALNIVNGSQGPLWLLVSVMIAFASSILIAWIRFAGTKQTYRALLAIPRYLMWKIPMYRAFFTHREKRWMKTKRD